MGKWKSEHFITAYKDHSEYFYPPSDPWPAAFIVNVDKCGVFNHLKPSFETVVVFK